MKCYLKKEGRTREYMGYHMVAEFDIKLANRANESQACSRWWVYHSAIFNHSNNLGTAAHSMRALTPTVKIIWHHTIIVMIQTWKVTITWIFWCDDGRFKSLLFVSSMLHYFTSRCYLYCSRNILHILCIVFTFSMFSGQATCILLISDLVTTSRSPSLICLWPMLPARFVRRGKDFYPLPSF